MTPENVFEWGAALAMLGVGICMVALGVELFRSAWKD